MLDNHSHATAAADAVVVGTGPAGLAAALSLAAVGARTLCTGPDLAAHQARTDTRTTALLGPSVQLLRNLGVWELCSSTAAPLEAIRIIDDTGHLFRAPEVKFHCRELGSEPFGFNIPNADLVAALLRRAETADLLDLIETPAASVKRIGAGSATIEAADGSRVETRLVAAADGRRSAAREAAGIDMRSWRYEQSAIACNVAHSAHHDHVSNEFHRPAGPFTTVPLPGAASSLVWVERPAETQRLMALDEAAFAAEVERVSHGVLGSISSVGPRAAFPLSGLLPVSLAQNRIALVGEAAHVIPPIGAQGLNLGFRDGATLASLAGEAMARGDDPGGDAVLRRYDRARRADIVARTAAVDLLNRSLLSGFLPVQALRGAGLHALKTVGPLRRLIMRFGVAPPNALPELMRA